jgi:ABC-type glycerol-3-phosphate transport system substrate-binding protein
MDYQTTQYWRAKLKKIKKKTKNPLVKPIFFTQYFILFFWVLFYQTKQRYFGDLIDNPLVGLSNNSIFFTLLILSYFIL